MPLVYLNAPPHTCTTSIGTMIFRTVLLASLVFLAAALPQASMSEQPPVSSGVPQPPGHPGPIDGPGALPGPYTGGDREWFVQNLRP